MIIVALFLIIYSGLLFIVTVKWMAIRPIEMNNNKDEVITICVACRNERDNLHQLIKSIRSQSYDFNKLELLIVDDHSTDGSYETIHSLIESSPVRIRALKLKDGYGKKQAITKAIYEARGSLIVCTDADCNMGKDWIRALVAPFKKEKVKMVTGPVAFSSEKNNQISSFLSSELAILVGVGAVTLSENKPTMCNGANIAFRRPAFYEVEGYSGNEGVASGDDEFLMHKIFSHYGKGSVIFQKKSDALVNSKPLYSLREFINQRKRWAGKWRHYKRVESRLAAFTVFFFNLCIIVAFLLSILKPLLLIPLSMKVMAEFFLMRSVKVSYDKPVSLLHFLSLSIIYPFYAIFFGLIALGNPGYSWKDRKYDRSGV